MQPGLFSISYHAYFLELPPRHCLSEVREWSGKTVETNWGILLPSQCFYRRLFHTSQESFQNSFFLRTSASLQLEPLELVKIVRMIKIKCNR